MRRAKGSMKAAALMQGQPPSSVGAFALGVGLKSAAAAAGFLHQLHAVTLRILKRHGLGRLPHNQAHKPHHQKWRRYAREKREATTGPSLAD
ncbi:MAG: hypothetical protein JOZ57_13050 [Abitibacteriaceae bacterium]|nr:hypothetical protein [Abditibacteriaceae bacterium]